MIRARFSAVCGHGYGVLRVIRRRPFRWLPKGRVVGAGTLLHDCMSRVFRPDDRFHRDSFV